MSVYLRAPTSLGKATLWKPFEILKAYNEMLTLRKPAIYLASISDFMDSVGKASRAEGLFSMTVKEC